MSHPYSGAAGYIYANEYRTPILHPAIGTRTRTHSHPTSPNSQASSLPSHHATSQFYSSPALHHPYAHPTLLPLSPASPLAPNLSLPPPLPPSPLPPSAPSLPSLRLPLKFRLTLSNPFRQNPPNSPPWPPPTFTTHHHHHQHAHDSAHSGSSTWRWSTLSGSKFKLSTWFPGVRRRTPSTTSSSNSQPKAKKYSSPDPMMHRSQTSRSSNQVHHDHDRDRHSPQGPRPRSGPARSHSYRTPTRDSIEAATKRGKSLRFAVGSGRRAERDLDFAIITA